MRGARAIESSGSPRLYLVLYADGVSSADGRAAVRAARGIIETENESVGLATVRSTNPSFAVDAAAQPALVGAAGNRRIAHVEPGGPPQREDVEVEALGASAPASARAGRRGADGAAGRGDIPGDDLSGLQWNMRRIRATADGSHALQRGSHEVLVGIIDTGIDARHPDLRRNLSRRLSRNFTTDIPLIDGPCREERDGSCADPPTVDEAGHGTHVAGIVAADLNGLGITGVAPDLRLVNLRAGQDSGYFFLQETVDALTYAGDAGIDVVNMSFFIDPWLYNCPANPADARAARREQRIVIEATQRALDYAHEHGVTLVAGAGNAFTDLGRPRTDHSSPGYPPGAAYHRDIDNSCLVMPVEGRHVVVVNAIGPSGRKAYYSNYGREQSDLSAPGGDLYERFGTRRWQSVENLILSTYPERVLRDAGLVRPNGRPSNAAVVRDCERGECGYYAYLQGTSMASPHVAGVAALIVSERGRADPRRRGLMLRPRVVRRVLVRTANARACPRPRRFDYPGLGPIYSARCAGTRAFNGFYGSGVVNALVAVRARVGREHR